MFPSNKLPSQAAFIPVWQVPVSDLEARIARFSEKIAYAETLYALTDQSSAGVPLEETQSHQWLSANNLFQDEQLQAITSLEQYESLSNDADEEYKIGALAALYNLLNSYSYREYESDSPEAAIDLRLQQEIAELSLDPNWTQIQPVMILIFQIQQEGTGGYVEDILRELANRGLLSGIKASDLAQTLKDIAPIGGAYVASEDGSQQLILNEDLEYASGSAWEDVIRLSGYADAVAADEDVANALPQIRDMLGTLNPYAEYKKLTEIKELIDTIPDVVADVSLATAKRRFRDFEAQTRTEIDLMIVMRQALLQADDATIPTPIADEEEYRQFLLSRLGSALGMRAEWTELSADELQRLAYRLLLDHVFEGTEEVRRSLAEIDREMRTRMGGNSPSILEIAFFILGFFPVFGELVDIVDILTSLASGDLIGAAINFLPAGIDSALQGAGRLARLGSDAMGRVASMTGRVSAEILVEINAKVPQFHLAVDRATQAVSMIRSNVRSAARATGRTIDNWLISWYEEFFGTGYRPQFAGIPANVPSKWGENAPKWQAPQILKIEVGNYGYGSIDNPTIRFEEIKIGDEKKFKITYIDKETKKRTDKTLTIDEFQKLANRMFPDAGYSVNTANSANSLILRESLTNAGHRFVKGEDAHHLVASGANQSSFARGELDKHNIGLNSRLNGVVLWRPVHDLTKNNQYYRTIDEGFRAISEVVPEAQLADVYREYLSLVGRKLSALNDVRGGEEALKNAYNDFLKWLNEKAVDEATGGLS